jgi:hypothetical protein
MLIEDMINECIEISGHNCYYIPRESFDAGDMILGEYSKSQFRKAYIIETYIASVEKFEGQGDFFSKFGLEIRDSSNFVLGRRAFNHYIPSGVRSRPQEGDLLYVPVMRSLFEVKFVEEEIGHFSLGKRNPYVYELKCEKFRYSQETIDTGVTEVDEVQADNGYTIKLNLNTNGTGVFESGDIAYQSSNSSYYGMTAQGTVKEWYKADGTLYLYNIIGSFSTGSTIRNKDVANTSYTLLSSDTMSDFVFYDVYDNSNVDTGADLILDLSELNPFGSP